MAKEILNFIGLMNRAGSLITGTELVLNGIRSGKVKFVLIDSQVSENTLKKITDKCRYYNVSYIEVIGESGLGTAIGNPSRKVAGITDPKFVKALQKKLKETHSFSQRKLEAHSFSREKILKNSGMDESKEQIQGGLLNENT